MGSDEHGDLVVAAPVEKFFEGLEERAVRLKKKHEEEEGDIPFAPKKARPAPRDPSQTEYPIRSIFGPKEAPPVQTFASEPLDYLRQRSVFDPIPKPPGSVPFGMPREPPSRMFLGGFAMPNTVHAAVATPAVASLCVLPKEDTTVDLGPPREDSIPLGTR